ncbi:hypothetical protein LINGRAHAP2_LOCUS7245 [Linum grandiflorum]
MADREINTSTVTVFATETETVTETEIDAGRRKIEIASKAGSEIAIVRRARGRELARWIEIGIIHEARGPELARRTELEQGRLVRRTGRLPTVATVTSTRRRLRLRERGTVTRPRWNARRTDIDLPILGTRSRRGRRIVEGDGNGTEINEDGMEMLKMLGIPTGFDSTKGKPVEGAVFCSNLKTPLFVGLLNFGSIAWWDSFWR